MSYAHLRFYICAFYIILYSFRGFSQEHVELILKPGSEEGKDSYVNSQHHRLGATQSFIAAAWTYDGVPGVGRSFIEFKLPHLPDSIANFHAYLNFYYDPTSGHEGHGGDNTCKLERIVEHWTENEMTWNNQPAVTSVNAVILPASTYQEQDYTNIDVTQLVSDMYANPLASFGIRLSLVQEKIYRSLIFASSDHNNPDLWPELIIRYDSTISEKKDILIYPNPTSGIVHIEYSVNEVGIKNIQIINSSGSLIINDEASRIKKKENGYTCDFTGLESGNYILFIQLDQGVFIHKEIFVADK